MYTKREFRIDLLEQLKCGYDEDALSKWCYTKLLDNSTELEEDLGDIMHTVWGIVDGDEFAMTEDEMRQYIEEECGT